MATLTDTKISRFRTQLGYTTQIKSIQDLERDFFFANSGLSASHSIADHKKAYYVLKGFPNRSLDDAELAYFKAQGAVGVSAASIMLDFYKNHVFV